MAQKQSDKKPPKYIEFGNHKIRSQKVPHKEDQYLWEGIYEDIKPAFWDDIYEAFDSQYFGENKIDIFLQHWDAWYDKLVNKYDNYIPDRHYDFDNIESFSALKYPSPWRGCTGENTDILPITSPFFPFTHNMSYRWMFVQTLKPPTRNISHRKRIIKQDLEERKKRTECKYANVYSILLLKNTYYQWINENQPISAQITQVYTGASFSDIADQIFGSKYKEFVFCGAIPYFLLSENHYKYFKNSISSNNNANKKRHTIIVSYPSDDNIQALAKLRRKSSADIWLDVYNTHSVLLELAWLSKHTKDHIRILYVDDVPSSDYFFIDDCKCFLSLDIEYLKNSNYVSRNETNLRTIMFFDDSRLVDKCRKQVLDIWISNLKEYSLNRFVCNRAFVSYLHLLIASSYESFDEMNLKGENFNKLTMAYVKLLNKIRTLEDSDDYLRPDESIFSKFYGYLYINTDQEKIFEDARRYKRKDFNFRGIEEEISLKLNESRD